MTLRFVVFFLLVVLCGRGAWAATPQEYDHALAQVQQALEARIPALTAHEIPTSPPAQYAARRLLAPITSVGPAGGPQQLVSNFALLRDLAAADRKGDVGKMKALDRQIATLRAEMSGRIPPQAVPAANAVARAHAILAERDYDDTPYPPPSMSERLARWISDEWQKIHWPNGPNVNAPNVNLPNISPGFIRTLMIVVIGGAIAVLVFVIVQMLSGRQKSGRAAPLLDAAEQALVEARDTDSLFALAERQAAEGDYRRAFRLIYIATLIALDTGGILRFNRSRTNWEYLRALRAAGREDVYQAILPLTREFDRIWYGSAPAGRAEYARAVAQYQALESAPSAAVQTAS